MLELDQTPKIVNLAIKIDDKIYKIRFVNQHLSAVYISVHLCLCVWEMNSLLSIFHVFNVTHGGLHVVTRFVAECERRGVVIRAVSQGPVRSAVSKGTRFSVGRQAVHLFFFVQEREFHFHFNCTTETSLLRKLFNL